MKALRAGAVGCLMMGLPSAPTSLAAGFEPPGAAERERALGPLPNAPPAVRRFYDPRHFEPMGRPDPRDWLAHHPEPGQSVAAFVRTPHLVPDTERRTIYLLRLGTASDGGGPSAGLLEGYLEAFFGLEVQELPPVPLEGNGFTTRTNPHSKSRQLLTGDVLDHLGTRVPPDAFCLVAVTMEDLYPDPDWNFVFGQASLQERVGIYSFARFDPGFAGGERGADFEDVLLRRSLKTLTHEVGHIFGMRHCTYYRCLMNGSNHLGEHDARPFHLCPICLRKLRRSTRFPIGPRYQALRTFYEKVGLDAEAQWIAERLRFIFPP